MAAAEYIVKGFISGTHNNLSNEVIPKDASYDSLNWVSNDGLINLISGRRIIGNATGNSKVYSQHTGYRNDGVQVTFRKASTKIQVLVNNIWVDVITDLTESSEYTFCNYQSLAGSWVYIFGPDGIYKIAPSSPTSFISLYDPAKNFKGHAFIDKARTILWGRKEDPTGLYGSKIDSINYTTVSNEVIGSSGASTYTGTLAFKAGDTKRSCFGVIITANTNTGTETFNDNNSGVLTSNFGSSGTINYTTGQYSITFGSITSSGVTATYQYENSNNGGVTDFTKSTPRIAGEGFVVRQDAGGTAIKTVLPIDGVYYSLKENMSYRFQLDNSDLSFINEIYRQDIGVKTLKSAVATGKGIVFVNTSNSLEPTLTILQKNTIGDSIEPFKLFNHYKFEAFDYSDAVVDTYDKYIIVSCKEDNAQDNNVLLLCNIAQKSVEKTYYGARSFSKFNTFLYAGDSVSQSTYELFTGVDDVGTVITNYWISKSETLTNDVLKKTKRLRLKGLISPQQSVQVSISYDDDSYELVGTVVGSGDYVDYTSTGAIGTNSIGQSTVGGGANGQVYNFLCELKLRTPKFRKRTIKLEARGFGNVAIEYINDFDIWTYQDKLPAKYRVRQNQSLDGLQSNL